MLMTSNLQEHENITALEIARDELDYSLSGLDALTSRSSAYKAEMQLLLGGN
jgi:hypothetical protein